MNDADLAASLEQLEQAWDSIRETPAQPQSTMDVIEYGLGSVAIVGGIGCCIGLKFIGGAALFGGLATVLGLSTDITTFLVGALGGLFAGVVLVGYRRSDVDIGPV